MPAAGHLIVKAHVSDWLKFCASQISNINFHIFIVQWEEVCEIKEQVLRRNTQASNVFLITDIPNTSKL